MNQIEKIFADLEKGYDQMADKFSETRKFFWRDLEFIAKYIKSGDKILDFGCGNGRLLEILGNKKVDYTGVDISGKLIKLARQKYKKKNIKFRKTSIQRILSPTKTKKDITVRKGYTKDKLSQDFGYRYLVGDKSFPDNYFNTIISIAVFHHFPEKYAQNSAEELFRILKPGGKIIVTAWNLEQKRFEKFRKGNSKDLYIPFRNNNQKEYFQRFHHLYTKKDLEIIFSASGFVMKKAEVLKDKNIFYFGVKPK